ncbi:hypothetical protein ABIE13_005385 [Ottowia thiooxydans]|uniref:Uncharacterized protein n=1 Tax=Ottowia thiooxydans TaxID=219182 RepID=A0ABV2QI30_9BURK
MRQGSRLFPLGAPSSSLAILLTSNKRPKIAKLELGAPRKYQPCPELEPQKLKDLQPHAPGFLAVSLGSPSSCSALRRLLRLNDAEQELGGPSENRHSPD